MSPEEHTTMPTIASVTVRYSRKYQVRKDDWAGFEAQITLAVSAEEADTTDPHEVAAQAFAIARRAVSEQAADLRRQIAEAAQRRAEPSAPAPAPYAPAEPPLRADLPPARANGQAPAPPPAEADPPFPSR
jgi:hypothetical protein